MRWEISPIWLLNAWPIDGRAMGGSKRGNNGGVDMGDRRIRRVTLRFGGEFYYYVQVEQYQEQENLLLMVVL